MENASFGKVVVFLVAFTVIIVVSALVNGWALALLWSWYMVPIFGLKVLTINQAIGVGIVIGFLTSRTQINYLGEDRRSGYDKFVDIIKPILAAPLIVFVAWGLLAIFPI